jgi:hypothetical protein
MSCERVWSDPPSDDVESFFAFGDFEAMGHEFQESARLGMSLCEDTFIWRRYDAIAEGDVNGPARENLLGRVLQGENFERSWLPIGPKVPFGFRSMGPPIPLLFVCRESYGVVASVYTKTFGTEAAFPET